MLDSTIFGLLNVTAINNYVSGRIWPNDAQTNAKWPYLVYNFRSIASVMTLNGATSTNMSELEIYIESDSVLDRQGLANDVKAILNGYSGAPIQAMYLIDETAEKIGDQSEGYVYVETLLFRVVGNG